MNTVIKTIEDRYSCRAFDGTMPAESKVQVIAKAALHAPSGMNRQAWRVIVVKSRGLIDEMEAEGMAVLQAMPDKSMYDRIQARGGTLYYHAPCMLMIPIDPTEYAGAVLDCGILCQTVALAATSLGVGNLICGMAGLAFARDKAAYFKEKLGFPPGFEFGSAILLGHAAKTAAPHEVDMGKISVIE